MTSVRLNGSLTKAALRFESVILSRVQENGSSRRCHCLLGARVVCATFAVLLNGCVFHQPYPKAWGVRSAGCPEIAGVYWDAGERWGERVPFPFHGTDVTMRSLSALLRGEGEPGHPFVVRLDRPDERTLRVAASGAQDTSPHTLPYRCTSRGLRVTLGPRWIIQGLSAVRTHGRLYLTKDADGNLIGNIRYQAYGVIFIVPMVAAGDVWYRFKAVETAP